MLETAVYLGPARILAVSPSPLLPRGDEEGESAVRHHTPVYVQVALADDEIVRARLALAVPYYPVPGDEVLVIFQELPDAFVIGVLRGSGTTTLRVPGDLKLEAPCGEVSIVSGKKVKIRSGEALELAAPLATFRFRRLNLFLTTLVQRVNNAFTWATGLIQTRSRRLRQLADEGWLVRADRAHLKSSDNFHINGKTIHLG